MSKKQAKMIAGCLAVAWALHGCTMMPWVSERQRRRQQEAMEAQRKREAERALLLRHQREETEALARREAEERAQHEKWLAERKAKQEAIEAAQREDERKAEEERVAEDKRIDAIKSRCGAKFQSKPQVGKSFRKWLDCWPYPDEIYLAGQVMRDGKAVDLYQSHSSGGVIYVLNDVIVAWH